MEVTHHNWSSDSKVCQSIINRISSILGARDPDRDDENMKRIMIMLNLEIVEDIFIQLTLFMSTTRFISIPNHLTDKHIDLALEIIEDEKKNFSDISNLLFLLKKCLSDVNSSQGDVYLTIEMLEKKRGN